MDKIDEKFFNCGPSRINILDIESLNKVGEDFLRLSYYANSPDAILHTIALTKVDLANVLPVLQRFYKGEIFPEKGSFYQNKKHRSIYQVVGSSPNCTNAQDGQILIHYVDVNNNLCSRERTEFLEKFEPYQHYEVPEFLKKQKL